VKSQRMPVSPIDGGRARASKGAALGVGRPSSACVANPVVRKDGATSTQLHQLSTGRMCACGQDDGGTHSRAERDQHKCTHTARNADDPCPQGTAVPPS
jgi:hypothetical protein